MFLSLYRLFTGKGESGEAPNPDWPQICDCPYRISIVPEEQMHYSMHYVVYQGFT